MDLSEFETTPSDDIPTETPTLVTEKLKNINVTESSVSTADAAATATTTNGEIPNTPPTIKQKLPKLPLTAGKPFR